MGYHVPPSLQRAGPNIRSNPGQSWRTSLASNRSQVMAYDDEDQPMRVREAREPLLERVATLEKLNRHLSEQVDKLTDQVRALANEIGL